MREQHLEFLKHSTSIDRLSVVLSSTIEKSARDHTSSRGSPSYLSFILSLLFGFGFWVLSAATAAEAEVKKTGYVCMYLSPVLSQNYKQNQKTKQHAASHHKKVKSQ